MRKTICILFLVLTGLISETGFAQKGRPRPLKKKNTSIPADAFFQTQWWIGLKGGAGVAKAVPETRHSVFVPTSSEPSALYDKQYESFRKVGSQYGLIVTYNFKSYFSLSFQPGIASYWFGYRNDYQWNGQANRAVEIIQQHRLKADYLELPLLARVDILRTHLRPYVQGGLFYGRLLKADKFMEVTSLDRASGATNPIQNTAPVIGAQPLLIRSQVGWMAGVGVSYDLGNIRLGLDATYKRGTSNITNTRNRYTDDRLTSNGDVLDDMKLRSIAVSFSVVMPMKFLELKSFRSVKP